MTGEAAKPRLFFALWPDAAVAQQLDDYAAQAHGHCGGRRMRLETLHLTLAFLGDVAPDRLAELEDLAGGIRMPGFGMSIDKLGHWARNRILWAGCSRPAEGLMQLVQAFREALSLADFRCQAGEFVPHVTLIRNARNPPPANIVQPLDWTVREFVLVQSRLSGKGADYRRLGRWPLRIE